jgi:hypothetical protein
MKNVARVLAFDVAAPAAAFAALLIIGVMLGWPLWWVSVCSMLCLLIVQAVIVNIIGYRRDSVTLGTDDDTPGLRLAVVSVMTAALVAAAVVGYTHWTVPDRDFTRDTSEVVRIASEVAEATATFTPTDPTAAIDRATAMMTPERAEVFRNQFAPTTADMAKRKLTAQAATISAGLEALAPEAATVAVLMRGTQTEPDKEPSTAVLSLRVALTKTDGVWKVVDVTPINTPINAR